jgi:hypothetical protein
MADDIKLETTFSKKRDLSGILIGLAGILAIVAIVVIVMRLIPPKDNSGLPPMPAGEQPLSLNKLINKLDEKTKTATIEGAVFNRSQSAIKGLIASIQLKDQYTLPFQTVNIPVEPAELPGRTSGEFHTTVDVGDHGLTGYVIEFKLGEKGPSVPHRDDRAPEPPPEQPKK